MVSEKGTRTPDRADMSRLLYQLSYLAICCVLCNDENLADKRRYCKRVMAISCHFVPICILFHP